MKNSIEEIYYACKTYIYWEISIEGNNDTYTVKYDKESHKSKGTEYDYSCTCKGYQFRGTCRHIEEAKKKHCNWFQFDNGEAPKEIQDRKVCPKCGEECIKIKVGV